MGGVENARVKPETGNHQPALNSRSIEGISFM